MPGAAEFDILWWRDVSNGVEGGSVFLSTSFDLAPRVARMLHQPQRATARGDPAVQSCGSGDLHKLPARVTDATVIPRAGCDNSHPAVVRRAPSAMKSPLSAGDRPVLGARPLPLTVTAHGRYFQARGGRDGPSPGGPPDHQGNAIIKQRSRFGLRSIS